MQHIVFPRPVRNSQEIKSILQTQGPMSKKVILDINTVDNDLTIQLPNFTQLVNGPGKTIFIIVKAPEKKNKYRNMCHRP